MPKDTGWVIIATEGATIDGRIISKQWIEDMAAQYSVDEYAALIWPEHFRSSWGPFEGKNWGEVLELKAAKQEGKVRLFAKLRANDMLLAANKEGQKLYTSIEPNPDYKGTGKCYLMGLAVTDSPASTGTSRLKFSKGDAQHECDYSGLEPINASDFFATQDTPSEQGLIAVLVKAFKAATSSAPTPTEETPMDKAQYDALMGKLDGIEAKHTELEGKIAAFSKQESKKPEGQQEDKPEVKPEATPEGGDQPATGISDKQFNTLLDKLDGIEAKQTKLTEDFNALKKEVPGQEPGNSGSGDTFVAV